MQILIKQKCLQTGASNMHMLSHNGGLMALTERQISHDNTHDKLQGIKRLMMKHEILTMAKSERAGPQHRGKQDLSARQVVK